MNDDMRTIATLLYARRKSLALSQKDMYMRIGMKQQQYQRIESGQDVRLSTLLTVLEGLGLEMCIYPKSEKGNVGINGVVNVKESSLEDDSDDLDFWFNGH